MITLRYDATALRRMLDERHWTLDILSRRTRLGKVTLHQIANRRTRPRADTLAKIAQGLDVPIGAFFTGGNYTGGHITLNGPRRRRHARAALTTDP